MNKKGKIISCILAVTVATSMGGAIPVFADTASTSKVVTQVSQSVSASHRLAGIDRYATAVLISQKGWSTSDTVILASGENYADALTSGPLAKKYKAPILLTSKASISAETIAEIVRLQAKNIIIIGSEGAVSLGVATQLKTAGFSSITRIGGVNRYETSTMVAAKLDKPSAVVIVSGQDFPDALSVSSIASKLGYPIILSEKSGLSDNAKKYIVTNGIKKAYIVGGQAVLYPTIEKQVTEPVRLAGANRYETNLAVLKAFQGEFDYDNVLIATGNNFADALAGGALASSPMILVGSSMNANTADYLVSKENLNTKILALGGEAIVSNSIIKSAIDDKATIAVTKNYSSAGTYSDGAIIGSVIISEAGVNLKNTSISGDLLIASTVGEGNVDLDNVTVTGKIIINGGGSNSVKLHNMHSKSVEIDKASGENVRVATDATSSIDTILISTSGIVDQSASSKKGSITVDNNSSVVLKGGFDNVQINGQGSTVKVVEGSIATLNVNSTSSKTIVDVDANSTVTSIAVNNNVSITGTGVIESVTVAKAGVNINLQTTKVGTLIVSAAAVGSKVNISSATTVANLNVNAAVTVSGTGTITNANIGANGTTIAITPAVTSVTAGVSTVVNGTTKDSTNSPVIISVPVGVEIPAPVIPTIPGSVGSVIPPVEALAPTINITSDNYIDTVVANGEIVNIDLPIGDYRSIIITGNTPKVSINAPDSSIVLNGSNINVLDIKDIASHSLYIKGGTVNSLIVEDINNDAHIVTLKDASVISAMIKSGAIVESEATSTNPFKDITVNYEDVNSSVVLLGNLATSNVQLLKGNKVKIEASLDNLSVSNEVDNVIITETSNIKRLEVNTAHSVISIVNSDNNPVDNLNKIFSIVSNIVTSDNTALNSLDNSNHEAAIAQRQTNFINFMEELKVNLGEDSEEGTVYESRNTGTLATLKEYSNKFLGLNQLEQLSQKHQLRYASSFRSIIRSNIRNLQEGNLLDYATVQNNIISNYSRIRPIIESSKFKGHFGGETPKLEVICPDSDTEVDVTDLFIKFDSPLNDISSYSIQSIYDTFSFDNEGKINGDLSPYFNVKIVNGQTRIFMVPTNNATSSLTNVMIGVKYMGDISNTNLMVHLNFPLQALRAAKTAIEAENYTNLTVVDISNEAQKLAAVQAVVDNVKGTTTAVVSADGSGFSVAISSGEADATTTITTATFVDKISEVSNITELQSALANSDIKTININGDITIPKIVTIVVASGQTLIINSKLMVEGKIEINGTIEVNGIIEAPPTIAIMSRMSRMASVTSLDNENNNPKLEVIGNGRIAVKAGALVFASFSDIITPTQDSVILYAGAMVRIGNKQYIGNNSNALIKLSNFTNSTKPVAGYFLNGDKKLLLVIFEKAEVSQEDENALDISILVKARRENQLAGELKIPNLNIIKSATMDNSSSGTIVIEASANLIINNETLVSENDPNSVFNATGGESDNRRGILFSKFENNLISVIHGDATMNKEFNTAIIKPEYFGNDGFYGTELMPTLDITFDPKEGDFTEAYWGGAIPLKGKYKYDMKNDLWESVTGYELFFKEGDKVSDITQSGLFAGQQIRVVGYPYETNPLSEDYLLKIDTPLLSVVYTVEKDDLLDQVLDNVQGEDQNLFKVDANEKKIIFKGNVTGQQVRAYLDNAELFDAPPVISFYNVRGEEELLYESESPEYIGDWVHTFSRRVLVGTNDQHGLYVLKKVNK